MNKQASKRTSHRNRLYNKRNCICIVLIQGKENWLKFAGVFAKSLKRVKCLPKILFNRDIMNLCLLPCFWVGAVLTHGEIGLNNYHKIGVCVPKFWDTLHIWAL